MAEKYLEVWDERARENVEDVITICESASKKVFDQIGFKFEENDDDAKIMAVMFTETYDAICQFLKKCEKDKSAESINFCNRFSIGYTTNDNEEDEKSGNFMISMVDLGNNQKDVFIDDPQAEVIEKAVFWKAENAKEDPEAIRDISIQAVKNLSEVDIQLEADEIIAPFFSIIYDAIVNYLKIRRHEEDEFEYKINFMGCFEIGARETEEGDDIFITPNIHDKLFMKDDFRASSKGE